MTYDQFLDMVELISINGDTLTDADVAKQIGASVEDVAMERADVERDI